MSVPWSSKGFKATPVNADELLIIDSADGTPATTNKRITIGSLPIIGEANTTSNSGSGEGLAQTKSGVDLPFKSLLGESGKIVLTGNTNDVTFTIGVDIVQTTQANTFGDFIQSFADNQLFIRNPTDTFSYQIIADAIGGNFSLSFPLLTANDTFVTEAFTQVLSNKELTTPIIADFTNATHDHTNLAGGGQLDATTALDATGTKDSTTFLRGDNTWDTPIGTSLPVVDTTSIVEGSADNTKELRFEVDGFTTATIRVLTPPDSDGTIVLESFAQTLTNKSITYSGRAQWNKGVNIASPAGGILTLGTDGNVFTITGTNTINEILATGWQAGSTIILEFDSILIVTNNSGGTNDIILGDGTNYTTAAGESLELWFDGTDWREISRSIGLGGGGTGITSLNGDTAAAQTLTGGDGIDIIDSTPDHSFAVDATVARTTDNLSVFASTTSSQLAGIISDETGTGSLVFATSPTLTTPVITDFSTATHDHQSTAKGGQLLSTGALSDTNDIAYLNTANTWSTGLQNFSAVSLRIPVSTTPSVTVDGDIVYDDTVADFTTGLITFFGTEEQGLVSMPIAEFTTPSDGFVVTYNATNDEFELAAAGVGGGDVVGPVIATDNAIVRFDGVSGTLIQDSGITIDDNERMANIQSLEFTSGTTPGAGTTHIALIDDDFHINTTGSNLVQILIDGVPKFQFDATSADFLDNDLTMGEAFIQLTTLTTPPTSTGVDNIGKIFMDDANDNHLSVIRNSTIFDLEENFPINFPEQTAAIATDPQEINFSTKTRHAQKYTLDQATTNFTFAGTTTDTTEYVDLLLVQDVTGGRAIAFPGGTINAAEVVAGLDQTALAETSILVKFHYGQFYVFLQGDSNGEVFTWTGNHSMATFKLTAEAANDVILNAPSTQGVSIEVNSVQTAKINAALANFNGQDATQVLELEANHTTPADAQIVGQLNFIDDNSIGGTEIYGQFRTLIQDPTSTTEDGEMFLAVMKGGTLTDYISLNEADNDAIDFKAHNIQNIPNILDSNGNELLIFTTTASAVNELTLVNAATGNPV